MADYKVLQDITKAGKVIIAKGTVVSGDLVDSGFGLRALTVFGTAIPESSLQEITGSATSQAQADAIKARYVNLMTIRIAGSSAGFLGGLAFAFHRKSKFWGYVGWALLGSIVVGGVVGLVSLPAASTLIKDAEKANVKL